MRAAFRLAGSRGPRPYCVQQASCPGDGELRMQALVIESFLSPVRSSGSTLSRYRI